MRVSIVVYSKRCGVVHEESVRGVQSSGHATLPTGGRIHTYIHLHIHMNRLECVHIQKSLSPSDTYIHTYIH